MPSLSRAYIQLSGRLLPVLLRQIHSKTYGQRLSSGLDFYAKVIAVAAGIVILSGFVLFVWQPVCRSTAKIQKAQLAISAGQFQQAHDLLSEAAEDDPLDQTALNINGRLYLQQYDQMARKITHDEVLLEKSRTELSAGDRTQ